MFDVIFGIALLAGVAWFFSSRGAIEWFLNLIDLGDALKRARDWVKRQTGMPAGILAVSMVALAWVCGELAWKFDILPTWSFMQWLAAYMATDGYTQERIMMIGFLCTIAPTLIELTAVGLGRDGVKFVEYLVYFFTGLDLVTDWEVSAGLIDGWIAQGLLSGLWGPVAFAAEWALKAGTVLFASLGFEFLFILFGATAVMLFLNLIPDKPASKGGGAKTGTVLG